MRCDRFGERDRQFQVHLWATVMLGLQWLAALQATTSQSGMTEISELLFQAVR